MEVQPSVKNWGGEHTGDSVGHRARRRPDGRQCLRPPVLRASRPYRRRAKLWRPAPVSPGHRPAGCLYSNRAAGRALSGRDQVGFGHTARRPNADGSRLVEAVPLLAAAARPSDRRCSNDSETICPRASDAAACRSSSAPCTTQMMWPDREDRARATCWAINGRRLLETEKGAHEVDRTSGQHNAREIQASLSRWQLIFRACSGHRT